MKDIFFRGKIQFGIWKFLESVGGVVKPQYGCAQPIENGVHLGNGNNTIEEVGSCEINPPVISCAGATQYIQLQTTQWAEHTITPVWIFTITNLETNELYASCTNNDFIETDEGLADVLQRLKTDSCPLNFISIPESAIWSIENTTNQNVRLRIDAASVEGSTTPVAIELSIIGGSEAHSWVKNEYENYILEFCLAPDSSEIIFCDGAISHITFGALDGVWDVQINVDLYDTSGRTVAQFLQQSFEGLFLVTDSEGVTIENLQDQSSRIKLIPRESTSYTSPTDNTTFLEHEDGSLTFCLSPPAPDPVVFGEIYQSESLQPVYVYLMSGKTSVEVTYPNNSKVTLVIEAGGEGYTLGEDQGLYKITGSFENLYSDIWFFADVNENPPAQPVVSSLTRGSDGIVQIVGSTSSQYSVVVLYGANMNDNNPMAFAPVDESGEFSMSVALPPNFTGWVGTQQGSFVSWSAEFTIA